MKKFLSVILAITILTIPICISAEHMVSVLINDEPVEFDVPPQIIDGRTMVPLRAVFEKINAKVTWIEEGQIIIISKGSKIIAMEIGKIQFNSTDVIKNESKVIDLDVPPQIIDSRTLVPIRAIAEEFGLTVDWIDETQTVVITE